MERQDQQRNALAMLRQGRSDEAVETLTELPLLGIIELRAQLAAAPAPTDDAAGSAARF